MTSAKAVKTSHFDEITQKEINCRRPKGEETSIRWDLDAERCAQAVAGYQPNWENTDGQDQGEYMETVMPGVEEDGEPLGEVERREYLSVAALLNNLAPDRLELLFAAKKCMRRLNDHGRGLGHDGAPPRCARVHGG